MISKNRSTKIPKPDPYNFSNKIEEIWCAADGKFPSLYRDMHSDLVEISRESTEFREMVGKSGEPIAEFGAIPAQVAIAVMEEEIRDFKYFFRESYYEIMTRLKDGKGKTKPEAYSAMNALSELTNRMISRIRAQTFSLYGIAAYPENNQDENEEQ